MRFFITITLLLSGWYNLLIAQQVGHIPQPVDTLTEEERIKAKAEYVAGIREFELENYQASLEHLKTAYIKLSDQAGVNYSLADTYLALEDLNNASYYAKQAVNLEPGNPWYHRKLAEIYAQSGKMEAAVREMEKAIELRPGNIDMYMELAQMYTSFGQLEKANQVYQKIIDKRGSDPQLHMMRFNNFNKLGMADSALAELETIRTLKPDDITILHRLSQFHLERGNIEKAKKILEDARGRNARNPKTLILLSDLYIRQANWERAGKLLNTMINDTLINPQDKLNIVEFLVEEYRNNPSDSTLKAVTREVVDDFTMVNSNFGMAHVMASNYYQISGDQEKSLEALEQTNRVMPNNDIAWRQRMQILFNTQRYEQVIEVGKKADQYVPDDPFILYFTGASYYIQGKYQPAVEWLDRATKVPARRSFKSSVYAMLGDTYASLKNWSESDKAYELALQLNAGNHNVLNNYAYYLSVRGEKLDKARQMIAKALQLDSNNASYLDTAGWVFYKLGDYEKALKYIKASIETGAASAEVYEHMGDVYDQLDQPQEAKKWWKKALEKDPSRSYLKNKINRES